MFIVNPYRFTPSVAFIGLLDTYIGGYGAYSVRLLKSSFASKAPLRVLRSSSSIEVDVYFDTTPIVPVISLNSPIVAVVGTTNATTLGEFVAASGYIDQDGIGPSSASVSKWADQFELWDVTQSDPLKQPILVSSGTLVTVNGHVTISLNGSQYLTNTSYNPGVLDDFSMFTVYRGDTSTGRSVVGFFETGTGAGRFIRAAGQNGNTAITAKTYSGNTPQTLSITQSASANNEYATYTRQGVTTGATWIYVQATQTTATSVNAAVSQTNGTVPTITPVEFTIGAHKSSNYAGMIGFISECFYFLGQTYSNGMTLTTRNALLLNQIQYF